jgi:hypothetical protein
MATGRPLPASRAEVAVVLYREHRGPAGRPVEHGRVHDRVQVDHVRPRGPGDPVQRRRPALARLEAGDEVGAAGRLDARLHRAHHQLHVVAEGEELLHDGAQVPVRASATAEAIADVQDAHRDPSYARAGGLQ